LLLDRSQKIYLANRAFKNLFGLKIELRGKTFMEALRLHELEELYSASGGRPGVRLRVKLPDLTERWLRVNRPSSPIPPASAGDDPRFP